MCMLYQISDLPSPGMTSVQQWVPCDIDIYLDKLVLQIKVLQNEETRNSSNHL